MHTATHKCDALVLMCMDWRLHIGETVKNQIRQILECKTYDLLVLPGGAKCLLGEETRNLVLSYIELSKKIHGVKKVLLINHTDCGAYGEAGTKERLIDDLREAADALTSAKISVEVTTCLANVSEQNGEWEVQLEEIDL